MSAARRDDLGPDEREIIARAAAAAPPPPASGAASAAPPAPLGSTAGAAGASGAPASAPCSGSGMLGRFTRLRTSLTAPGTSSMCGRTCSPNW
jgi:hypothetical protein